MSKTLKVVAVSGGLNAPSKTESLLDAIIAQLGQALPIELHYVKLSEIGPLLAGVISRSQLPERVEQDLAHIESADVLIVGTPVYRASFTGLFKHLFDFVEQTALVDVPVLLAASGGSDRHALVLEHQLRPLFSFFQAQTLPVGVYATDRDFSNYQVTNQALLERIELAVSRALPVLTSSAQSGRRQLLAQYKTAHGKNSVHLNVPINQPAVLPVDRIASPQDEPRTIEQPLEGKRVVGKRVAQG